MLRRANLRMMPRSYGSMLRDASGAFLSGVGLGFGGLPALYGIESTLPRYRSRGIAGDWQNVGSYLESAMTAHADESAR